MNKQVKQDVLFILYYIYTDNTSRDLKDAEIYYSKAKDFVNKNRELQSASKQMTEQMEALLKASEQLISPSPSSSVDLT